MAVVCGSDVWPGCWLWSLSLFLVLRTCAEVRTARETHQSDRRTGTWTDLCPSCCSTFPHAQHTEAADVHGAPQTNRIENDENCSLRDPRHCRLGFLPRPSRYDGLHQGRVYRMRFRGWNVIDCGNHRTVCFMTGSIYSRKTERTGRVSPELSVSFSLPPPCVCLFWFLLLRLFLCFAIRCRLLPLFYDS